MAPLKFYSWKDDNHCICTMTSSDKLTENELEDIANRHMKIETDKGTYRILSKPEEEWGGELNGGGHFRSYLVEVEQEK